jgi:(1->4)-alpha-D-glucan 1-alpha-D-glucosylmutase
MEEHTTSDGGMVSERMKPRSIPLSTYRLQFNRSFTFSQAADLVPYLAELGITHCYASPYLRSRPGSMHGYDIIDHHHLDPEIGTPEDYERFVAALHQHGMGQILDVVPNHMGILSADNAWWLEVLENGEASTYADFFDIDWYPLKDELQGKVLVPVLGDQYGTVLDRGELKLTFDAEKGEFSIFYFQHRFPVNPREYPRILGFSPEVLQQQLGADNENLLELQSLISAFNHLPGREEGAPEKRAERLRDKEIHKRRLAALCARSREVTEFIDRNVEKINGTPGDSSSFDTLHELIKAQAYRLAYWRVAADDINYRRFFDVNDLAGLRQENEAVFVQTHEFVLQLLRESKIDGLRVDHPDGLYDPKQYFERVQSAERSDGARSYYLVAEKILTGDEQLPGGWPIHGTTGYNFSNLVNGLFVDSDSERKLDRIYRAFIGRHANFKDLVYKCKKLVMDQLLNSELNVLANHLSRIALADRHTCDFTLKSLRDALTEIVACFPVYRTYVTEQGVSESDRAYINEAVDCAKEKSSTIETSVYDFIREVLLTSQGQGHPQFYQRSVIHFAMKFQQYTSALMAKGVEDTSFYRYNRLVSLNDVGGDPLRFGTTPEQFHREIVQRSCIWPHEMSATSTHDSKRSEDVRARINVLSEIPMEWHRKVRTWREMNREKKTFYDASGTPTPNDEYLLYQTLVGAWPTGNETNNLPDHFVKRICEYMLKAVREAKEKTSWANQNKEYEDALTKFVEGVFGSRDFRNDFIPFQRKISYFGMLNSLSQTMIKFTVPGVPDTYQGNELWELNLVDPDNRRAVDYDVRRHMLAEFKEVCDNGCDQQAAFTRELAANMYDGRIKAYLIWKILNLRKRQPDLFQLGEYVPLEITGERAKHLVAFARRRGTQTLILVAPRLCAQLLAGEPRMPSGEEVWQDVQIRTPGHAARFRDLFTGENYAVEHGGLLAKHLFHNFPVAMLLSE